MAIRGVAFV